MKLADITDKLATRMVLEAGLEQAQVRIATIALDGKVSAVVGAMRDCIPDDAKSVEATRLGERWDHAKNDVKAGRVYSVTVEDAERDLWVLETFSPLRSPAGRVTGALYLAMALPVGTIRGVCDV